MWFDLIGSNMLEHIWYQYLLYKNIQNIQQAIWCCPEEYGRFAEDAACMFCVTEDSLTLDGARVFPFMLHCDCISVRVRIQILSFQTKLRFFLWVKQKNITHTYMCVRCGTEFCHIVWEVHENWEFKKPFFKKKTSSAN